MLKRISSASVVLFAATVASAAPVTNPNGRVVGTFGDTELDLPVVCERDPMLIVRSHDGPDAPGVEIFLGNPVGMEIRTEAETLQFGTRKVDRSTFPVTIEGTVKGTDYALQVDCPDDFAG